LFTLGDEPALAADSAQNAALDDLFTEAFEQGILRLGTA
jgi:ABC-type cobalamin transport system ATPase subunit